MEKKRDSVRDIYTKPEQLLEDQSDNVYEKEMSAKESAISKSLDHLLSTKDMDVKSRLKPKQVLIMTKFKLFSMHYKSPVAEFISEQVLKLNVSIDGLGRKEVSDIVRSLPQEISDSEAGLMDKLFNVRT